MFSRLRSVSTLLPVSLLLVLASPSVSAPLRARTDVRQLNPTVEEVALQEIDAGDR